MFAIIKTDISSIYYTANRGGFLVAAKGVRCDGVQYTALHTSDVERVIEAMLAESARTDADMIAEIEANSTPPANWSSDEVRAETLRTVVRVRASLASGIASLRAPLAVIDTDNTRAIRTIIRAA